MHLGWLTRTVRRWLALTGGVVTLATIALFAVSNFRLWAWLAIAFLFSWVVAFALTARAEHQGRTAVESSTIQGDPRRQLLKDQIAALADEAGAELAKVYERRDPTGSMERFKDWASRVETLLREALEPSEVVLFLEGAFGEPKSDHPVVEAELWDTRGARLRRLLERFDTVKIRDDWQR